MVMTKRTFWQMKNTLGSIKKKEVLQMNKFEKLMQNGSRIYYKYFLFGSDLEQCVGKICIDTETGKSEITKLAEWDYEKGKEILVQSLILKEKQFPEQYIYTYC